MDFSYGKGIDVVFKVGKAKSNCEFVIYGTFVVQHERRKRWELLLYEADWFQWFQPVVLKLTQAQFSDRALIQGIRLVEL